jgi:RNA polymerase sigma-70 factor (ECF subfamily)
MSMLMSLNAGDSQFQVRLENLADNLERWATVQMPDWLRSRLDPSDLVQTTLIDVLKNADIYKTRTDQELLNYLRRAMTNNLIDAVRKFGRGRSDVSPDVLADTSRRMCDWLAAPDTSPSERFSRNERYNRLADGLSRLPDTQRIVVEMRYFQNARLAEIARLLGKSEGAVAAMLHRAISTLRDELIRFQSPE